MKEQCKYGNSCYRKRPEHFIEFDHPPDHEIANMFAKKRKIKESKDEPKSKIPKHDGNKIVERKPVSDIIETSLKKALPNPFGLYVTKVPGVTQCDFPQDGFIFSVKTDIFVGNFSTYNIRVNFEKWACPRFAPKIVCSG